MSWSGILGKTAVGLGAVAVPMVFALAGAGQASADPGGVCVSGPWGTHPHASMGPDGSLGPALESLARNGETMTVAQMATYAYVQIDQARAELNAISK